MLKAYNPPPKYRFRLKFYKNLNDNRISLVILYESKNFENKQQEYEIAIKQHKIYHYKLTESNSHIDGIPLSVNEALSFPKLFAAWQV